MLAPRNEGDVQGGVHNNRRDELAAMDDQPGRGYLMDRFTDPPFTVSAVTGFGAWADPNLRYLAGSYELAGRNFQPAIGPTRPNIMMAVNGTAHGGYSNRPDPRPSPWYSIFDELAAYGHSWRVYLALPPSSLPGTVWYSLVPPGQAANVTTAGRFLTDLATGHLRWRRPTRSGSTAGPFPGTCGSPPGWPAAALPGRAGRRPGH